MSDFLIKPLDETFQKKWDEFVNTSVNGTLFHKLSFLSYHGNRFKENEHHLVIYKGNVPYGVLPLAIFEEEGKQIAKSPYGASYGGPVFQKNPGYNDSKKIVEAFKQFFRKNSIDKITFTFPIAPCFKEYSETFYFALLEKGFKITTRDISSVVNLQKFEDLDNLPGRSRYEVKKAIKEGVTVRDNAPYEDFWGLMETTFQKHETNPTHSKDELTLLLKNLPGSIRYKVAYHKNVPIAGLCEFIINKQVNSSFYFCSDPRHKKLQGLSYLIYDSLKKSKKEGFYWYDFGTSSVNMRGRENIFRFKEGFGAMGIFRDKYEYEI